MAAWRLARAGHRVVVSERAPVVGGMAASVDVAGVRADLGSHRLHPSIDPAILAELRGLLGADLQTRPRNGRIRLQGRWIGFPLRTADLVRHLPPAFAIRAVVDAVTGPLRRPRSDTFAEVIRAGLGPTMADGFYLPYAEKLWDHDPGDLDGDLARRRVSAGSPLAIVRRLLAPRPTFLYPRRGFGPIVEALAAAATAAGAELRLGAEVDRIDPADLTLSTIPLAALARLTDPPGPDVGLEHRAMVLAYLVLDRPRYTEFDAHYFPELDVPMSRLSEPKNYRDSADDPSDRTVLCAELPCWVDDGTWTAEPTRLGERVADALARCGLPDASPVEVAVRRLPRVYPVYRQGYAARFDQLDEWAASVPGLVTLGRQGLFVPDNTHHVLAMGAAVADAVGADGTVDEAAWAADRERFTTHVVED